MMIASRIGTPALISVPSVRVKRAMALLETLDVFSGCYHVAVFELHGVPETFAAAKYRYFSFGLVNVDASNTLCFERIMLFG